VSYSVLIVDDNPLVRRALRACIEEDSVWHVCGEAKNGLVAVQKVKKLHPDIVILDLQMPVMNGLEAARQIRNIAPHTAMIMFTMFASTHLLKEAQTVGIRAVVSKSLGNPEHLLATLRNLCSAPMF
jgi:two-component system nitrate/nitrite response regulator NarL